MSTPPPPKRTAAEVQAAKGKTIRDVIRPGLDVLFCGINPGLYTAATGHHFARAGNRFWPALFDAGFTPRRLFPWEQQELLDAGCGATNFVARATATAAELDDQELRDGGRRLERKIRRDRPRVLAMVGLGAYRIAFDRPRARLVLQEETVAGACVWLLPNTSGRAAGLRTGIFVALRGGRRHGKYAFHPVYRLATDATICSWAATSTSA